jgi:hypothetical protein
MLRRLLVGLVIGFLVGGLVAAGLVFGLKITEFGASTGGVLEAYLAAALSGVVTGLVAGKPIWSTGGKIEAGLKAFFGALLGVGAMFALRQWAGGLQLDLSAIGAGHEAPVGYLPAASLPMIAAVLGGFFELDNTEAKKGAEETTGPRKRVAQGANGKARVAEAAEAEGEEAEVVSRRAKR